MKMLFAAVTLLAAVSLTVGAPECQWGPSYWCQSKETAQKCGQLQYCQENIWKVKVEAPQDLECDVCEEIVKFLDKELENKQTEADAKAEVEKLCSALGPLESICKVLVDYYFDEIWGYLVNKTDPTTICTKIGLCTSATLKVKAVQQVKIDECSICKDIVDFADEFIDSNKTEAEVLDELEKVCTYFGALAEECKSFLNDYFPKIWEELMKETDPTKVCTELGLCTSATLKVKAVQQDGCDVCKDVCEFLQTFLDNNATEKEALEFLEKVCQYIPGVSQADCDKFLNTNFTKLWKEMQEEFDKDKICYQLKVCSNSVARKPRPAAPKADLCAICELVVSFLKPFVDSNSTEEEVEDAIEKLCQILPSSVSTECLGLVKQFFPIIWPIVKREFDNDEICKMLRLCPSVEVRSKVSAPKDELCDLCHLVVNYLKVIVDNSTKEKEAKEGIEKLCGLFPGNYKNECLSYVKTYFDIIWDLLDQEVDSGKLCQQIHLCPNTTLPVPMEVRSKVSAPKDELCDLCHLVVSYLKVIVDNSTKEATAKAELEKLCDLLPGNIKTDCIMLVENNFDKIWEGIEKEVDSGKLCEDLGLCTSAALPIPMVTRRLTAAKSEVAEPESILCAICELVMEKIESLLVNNATETEIIEVIEKVCDLFPKAEREYCDKFIEEYGKEIIKALVDGVGPKLICTLIHLCIGDSETIFSFSMEPDSVECDVCIEVLTLLKAALGSNASKGDVEKFLNEVCSFFPKELVAECTAFVDEYIKEIVQLIVQDIDPEKVCEALKVCTKTSALASPWKMLEKAFSGKFN